MLHAFIRTQWLIGEQALKKLNSSTVAVFGIGGVGSFAVEALARCGVGTLILVDYDRVCPTNINRQIHADVTTIGRPKVDAMKERLLKINPDLRVICRAAFYGPDTADELLDIGCDYVIDAIDTIGSKVDLVVRCKQKGIPIISSMGAGNKMDPTAFRVGDIYQTSVDPIAKVMRRELKKRGIDSLKVVYSTEPPIKPKYTFVDGFGDLNKEDEVEVVAAPPRRRKHPPGSISFVPPVVGFILASEVVKDLIGWPRHTR
ncbi:tRNA A37 threonylcarbamoyladenosine dehydratase [Caldicoprobacter guelmensis]|uniref:tRNA threonylcarbamoyladenosine dehydratase n=1 Tax=Caldicoprobacter guelmensis TaxID=1170224 RepID=UPI0019586ECB|nr:tRNA threonylcarbamoyladenosine dehydratase [Caldicoprobacter guelmensis]MBM7582290.1 tRNA A37 threonylcarbamoyladenosine dehydratase [Caldicoprobacter guelmensis]